MDDFEQIKAFYARDAAHLVRKTTQRLHKMGLKTRPTVTVNTP